jgi:hypothetical protein
LLRRRRQSCLDDLSRAACREHEHGNVGEYCWQAFSANDFLAGQRTTVLKFVAQAPKTGPWNKTKISRSAACIRSVAKHLLWRSASRRSGARAAAARDIRWALGMNDEDDEYDEPEQ